MTRNKFITNKAANDIRKINDWYIEEAGNLVAMSFMMQLNKRLNHLQEYPFRYASKHKSIRRCMLTQFPYSIFYIVDGNSVLILRIRHFKQKPLKRFR